MAIIINIDTSSNFCSVALAIDGEIVVGLESAQKMDHSTSLAPFVEKCFESLRERGEKLDAISVVTGPGSYTGLRIGLSLAKGIAFGQDIPLICVSSLEVMAVRGIFSYHDFQGDEIIIPMMDAGRMEVYTGIYDSALHPVQEESALILEEKSFSDLPDDTKILFIGDGTEKFKELFKKENAVWLGAGMPHAKYMAALSEKYYREKKFSDVAYTVPRYLKEYKATKPKNMILK
ncbi:MAG: tRNA (adenosine(37)-N6)-threonylcarbamoyltransferase complex dimerization subunit type 1 TsaB [Muribaculaceae bacterium]|nr:tRNA (adenosine(37)-N6)-threonylcarbamoyltransferase complex dimerization subunit type 1 TsaB [Muribaculaceae bacterium]